LDKLLGGRSGSDEPVEAAAFVVRQHNGRRLRTANDAFLCDSYGQ
jgi:hypothetical protein